MSHEPRRKALKRFADMTLGALCLAMVAIPILVVVLGR